MISVLQRMWHWLVAWFRPGEQGTPLPPKINPENTLLAADVIPPIVPAPQEPLAPPRFISRPGKFVKPKGEAPPKLKREHSESKKPRKPRVKLPDQRPLEDPEQWGQYYFRDAILDQLETYFVYLKRMKKSDRDAYDLHRRMGIQIMPASAIQTFDNWRNKGEIDDLSAWWKETRPSFGAVAYGIDKGGLKEEATKILDAPPEFWKKRERRVDRNTLPKNRIGFMSQGRNRVDTGYGVEREGMLWVPKFLYFFKYDKVSKKIEHVSNADIYAMTVYWDRVEGCSRGWHKRHPGGAPQEYALCIDRETNKIRVLRHQVFETLKVKSRRTSSGYISIPQKRWTSCADTQLAWAFGRFEASPENYLIRCFIEAALMYESASMGSMVRIQVNKGSLAATFGVDIKRMSYFFKDRDIVLTAKGKRARIFHLVRPHKRQTKHGEIGVKLSFRGLRQFTWAGYQINITVPGRDHFNLNELNISADKSEDAPKRKDMIGTADFANELQTWMDEGRGAWRHNAN